MAKAPTGPPSSLRRISPATLYFFGALGGILFGYDLGVIAGVLVVISKVWQLTGLDKGVVTASLSVGAMVGAGLAGRLTGLIGRRRTIMAAAGVVILGTVACALAPGFGALVAFRTVLGVGIGLSSATVPTYLSELAPSRIRGAMGSLNQIFIVSGILIAFLVDYWLQPHQAWRWMLAGALVPAVLLVVGLTRLPETPRWLINLGKDDEARAVLECTHRGEDVDAEISAIREVIRIDSERVYRIRDLGARWVRPMLFVAILLAVGQQFSGVNAINAYFPTMLVSLGFTASTALLSAVVLGVTKLVFTAWVVFVVDRWGRKPLLLIGNVIMVVTLALTGWVVISVHDQNTLGTLAVVLLVLYLAGYELGWGAVVWVMMAEVFPLKARGAGMGVGAVVLWAATGIVTAVFPIMSDDNHLGLGNTMFVFAGVNAVLFVLTRWLVPETKGRSLEQIELGLRDGK
ncbi:sugar porter family MFS transporter [Streptomyces sp. SL13]|jgi:sugar porter (SP) family MFS transporter|uniref:Sugar porter family MFS transporter n=1 Tax=Streptantibioticus silvisoli TaxID=2705255 RepID=A0AA90GYR0_9ACTN|nr:sugar porter family MFS transporter [Streptantibioticus silvisoli]MDI5962270.1 sugar porter family MFS transporter [Streptantibioticus silvisoli]MDI5970698.1 sugar porter family MFS transporter [Streptantibioticus silvisoli]